MIFLKSHTDLYDFFGEIGLFRGSLLIHSELREHYANVPGDGIHLKTLYI